jgi:hypothetical protein
MSNNNSLYVSTFSDKFGITKIVDKIDFIKNCSTGIVLFTIVTGLIAFENYRKSIYHNNEVIQKINDINEINKSNFIGFIKKIDTTNKTNELKFNELIESNNKIIQILEKYSELLEIINQNPLLNFGSKGTLSKCSSSLSILTINDEKEDLIYANIETKQEYKEQEQEPEYTESVHSESEYTDLIDECYDALPCSNSKKATAFNRIFKWN